MAGDRKEVYLAGPMQVENGLVEATPDPCEIVKFGTDEKFVVAGTADTNVEIFVLDKQRLRAQGIDSAYKANDPARAYRCVTGLRAQVKLAAGTYTGNQALKLAAGGQVQPASGTDTVIAYLDSDDAGTVSGTDAGKRAAATFTNRP